MSLSGHLATVPVQELFQFLGTSRATGVLTLDGGTVTKRVAVEAGSIQACSSGRPKELLGHHVLTRTAVTEDDLERAFRVQYATPRPLGSILVERGTLAAGDVDDLVRHQHEDSLRDLFTWSAGRFDLEDRPPHAAEVPLRLALPWERVVADGAERLEAWRRVQLVLPTPDMRLRVRRECFPPGFPRELLDQRLVYLVERGHTIADICCRFHESDLEVMNRLRALVEAGHVLVEAHPPRHARPALPREEILGRSAVLRQAGLHTDARGLLREGCRQWPGDVGVTSALRGVEAEMRGRAMAALQDLDLVPFLPEPPDSGREAAMATREAFVVGRVNGRWSLRSIVRMCPFEELDALVILEGFFRSGLIAVKVARGGSAGADEVTPPPKPLRTAPGPKAVAPPARPAASRPRPRLAELEPGPGNRDALPPRPRDPRSSR